LFSPELAAVGPAADLRPPGGEHPVRFAAFREIPWHLFGSLCAGRSQVAFRTPYLDNEIVALAFQAPPAARQSGASAVEFIRQASPRMATIPTDRGEGGEVSAWRRKLRRVHAEVTFKLDYYCSEGLPLGLTALDPLFQRVNACLGIQGQHKFLTYRNWLRRELVGWAEERLAAAAQADLPFLDSGKVRRLGREHATGRRNFTREINAVLTLEAVRRLLLRPDGGNGFHRDDHP
jgi:asparagine synthase (glutamine-hydrolysing)